MSGEKNLHGSSPSTEDQSHVISYTLKTPLPSRHLMDGGKVKHRPGSWTAGLREGSSLPSPAASHGEEVMNEGSYLLSTWNIPGHNDKGSVWHNPPNPKNTIPGGLLTVLQGWKQTQRGEVTCLNHTV